MLFFDHCKMLKNMTCTAIKLVPKVPNPYNIKQYRPISCVNVLYKIVAKVLSRSFQKMSSNVVNMA